ncbi:MAG: acyl carrier protein [Anaerolineae bacterium]|nr:acyl carrier protein [Anaerolineae bacterium]
MEIREAIRRFILKEIMRNEKFKLKDDDSLIKGGLIDSWSLAQVGLFLEDTYGMSVPDSDLTADNMDSVEMIARYVEARRQ